MDISKDYRMLCEANKRLKIDGGYFCYHLTPEAMYRLLAAIATYPEESRSECIPALEWHCTVMYSKVTGRSWMEPATEPYAVLHRFENWTDHKGRAIIVALLRFPKAVIQHRNLAENGWKHGYHEYNPHVNLVKATSHPEWAEAATKKFSGMVLPFKDFLFSSPMGL